jgi:SanA protein
MRAMRPRRKPQPESKPPEKAPARSAVPPKAAGPAQGAPLPKSAAPSSTATPPKNAAPSGSAAPKETPIKRDPPPRPQPLDIEEEHDPEGLGRRIHREMAWFDGFLRRWLVRLMVLCTHLTIALVACYLIVWTVARGRSYDKVDQVPVRMCGLVLGTIPKVNGRDNIYFTSRIQAAADLYRAEKVQYLIVSGDNSNRGYDEPTMMKAALVAKGVPAQKIYCDYAGFRTLDSVVRAQKIFGQDRFTIISQAFHNPRALYIARRKGIVDCIAFNAPGAPAGSTALMHVRELGARIQAILDVEFLKTEPKFLGEKVQVGEKHPPVDANPLPKQ